MSKVKQTLMALNGKKLPISILVAGTVAVATLQAQVANQGGEIEKLRPMTEQVARIEERVDGIKEDFIDFRDEQRKVNDKHAGKLDRILEAVMR